MGDLLFPSGGTFDRRAARSLPARRSTAGGDAWLVAPHMASPTSSSSGPAPSALPLSAHIVTRAFFIGAGRNRSGKRLRREAPEAAERALAAHGAISSAWCLVSRAPCSTEHRVDASEAADKACAYCTRSNSTSSRCTSTALGRSRAPSSARTAACLTASPCSAAACLGH